MARFRIGTAGWALPAPHRHHFRAEGSSLRRYAERFDAAEINSSFHRPHRPTTYERWAAETPVDFRFSAKLPKTITHQRRLIDCAEPLDDFASQISGLGQKLAILLVQLPPKLAFDRDVADAFFADLAQRTAARIACEPRHPSWFEPDADELLRLHGVARVVADPVLVENGDRPGGAASLAYFRLHGAPRVYFSQYERARLQTLATSIRMAAAQADEVWVIFDNTAGSHAAGDALALAELLDSPL